MGFEAGMGIGEGLLTVVGGRCLNDGVECETATGGGRSLKDGAEREEVAAKWVFVCVRGEEGGMMVGGAGVKTGAAEGVGAVVKGLRCGWDCETGRELPT